MSEEKIVTLQILNRDYRVKCHPEQQTELEEAARYVQEKMQKLKTQSSTHTPDQIAVVTALNICHEWLQLKKQYKQQVEVSNQQFEKLSSLIETALGKKADALV